MNRLMRMRRVRDHHAKWIRSLSANPTGNHVNHHISAIVCLREDVGPAANALYLSCFSSDFSAMEHVRKFCKCAFLVAKLEARTVRPFHDEERERRLAILRERGGKGASRYMLEIFREKAAA